MSARPAGTRARRRELVVARPGPPGFVESCAGMHAAVSTQPSRRERRCFAIRGALLGGGLGSRLRRRFCSSQTASVKGRSLPEFGRTILHLAHRNTSPCQQLSLFRTRGGNYYTSKAQATPGCFGREWRHTRRSRYEATVAECNTIFKLCPVCAEARELSRLAGVRSTMNVVVRQCQTLATIHFIILYVF